MTTAAPIKILHVEDDANDALLFQHASSRAGVNFEIKSVNDGDDAIAYLCGVGRFSDRNEFPVPQLILLDLKMQRLNGFDVLTWLRTEPRFAKIPVIVLTSSNHQVDIRRAQDLGASSYLVKPVGFEGLVEVARTISDYCGGLSARGFESQP